MYAYNMRLYVPLCRPEFSGYNARNVAFSSFEISIYHHVYRINRFCKSVGGITKSLGTSGNPIAWITTRSSRGNGAYILCAN